MADMQDYSGPFQKDIKLEDFSKEALIRLYQAACRDYLGIDGLWLGLMRQKYGDKQAWQYHINVWEGGTKGEVMRTRGALNIEGTDVEAVMKYVQTSASLGGLFHIDCELFDKEHGRYTITKCHALDYFEKHGDTELLKQACERVCIPYNQRSADWFDPKIKWVPVKLPPRASKDEPACIWDIYLEK
ncbi:MAG: DUF6125 family protein [Chloroflexota bacterium]|nr:DUF6125 family protein [Chloroflexota bacterium]